MLNKWRDYCVSFILNRPKTVLLLFSLINLSFLPGLSKLGSDFTYKAWYNDQDKNVQQFQKFEQIFGNDDNLLIVIHDARGVLTQKNLKAISELEKILWESKEVYRVETLNNFQYTESIEDDLIIDDLIPNDRIDKIDQSFIQQLNEKIDRQPVLNDYLISEDRRSVLIHTYLRPAFGTIPDHSLITKDIRQKLTQFAKNYPHLTTHLTGSVTIVDDFKTATEKDLVVLIPLLYLVLCVIVYWRYRSITVIALVFSTISLSVVLMLGFSSYLGYKINTLTSACPTILMTVALSDAVHIFSAFFVYVRQGNSYIESVDYSLKKNFYPTLLTSLTTAVGFLSFFDSLVRPVAEMGVTVAIGVVFAWIVTYLFLGPVLIFMRQFIEKRLSTREPIKGQNGLQLTPRSKIWTDRIVKNAIGIILISFLALGIGGYFTTKINVNMDPMAQFKGDHHSVVSNNFLLKEFGFASSLEMMIDTGVSDGVKDPQFLKNVDRFKTWLVQQQEVRKVVSITDILKDLNQSFNDNNSEYYRLPDSRSIIAEYLLVYSMGLPLGKDINNLISLDQSKIRLTALWNLRDSQSSLDFMKKIVDESKKYNLNLSITGKNPLFHALTPYIVETFFHSLAMALIGITLILVFCLRSLTLGLLSLIPNVFPLIVGGGLFYLFGLEVDMGTVVVASVCLGIAVDDSIHFLFEYQKYRGLGKSSYDSVRHLMTSTYPALFMTTITLSAGFASFIAGQYIPNVKFGVSVALVLLIALVADFLLLPAILLKLHQKR
jgi:predicted RND superfamily exporter protein